MWLYCTKTDSPNQHSIPNTVLYDYQSSRSDSCVREYLSGYTGYLQVDGYAGYEQTSVTLVGCWAHARRKFKEAKQAAGKSKSGRVDWALNHIQKLYRIEKVIKDQSPEEKYQERQAQAKPLLEQYKAWLDNRSCKYRRSLPSALPLVTAYDNGPSSVVISTMDSLPSIIIGRSVPSSPSSLAEITSCSPIPPKGRKPVPPYTASLSSKGQWPDTIQLSHAFTD